MEVRDLIRHCVLSLCGGAPPSRHLDDRVTHDSRWALMSAIVFDGDQPRMTPAGPDFISVVMRTTEVEITTRRTR
jgi:hypothetical protein